MAGVYFYFMGILIVYYFNVLSCSRVYATTVTCSFRECYTQFKLHSKRLQLIIVYRGVIPVIPLKCAFPLTWLTWKVTQTNSHRFYLFTCDSLGTTNKNGCHGKDRLLIHKMPSGYSSSCFWKCVKGKHVIILTRICFCKNIGFLPLPWLILEAVTRVFLACINHVSNIVHKIKV